MNNAMPEVFPKIVVDREYGKFVDYIDLDLQKISDHLRNSGLTDEQILETNINLKSRVPVKVGDTTLYPRVDIEVSKNGSMAVYDIADIKEFPGWDNVVPNRGDQILIDNQETRSGNIVPQNNQNVNPIRGLDRFKLNQKGFAKNPFYKDPQVGKTDAIKQAQQIAKKTEALKKQGKITPNDEGYWTTPVKGQPKDPIPNVKDVNGVQVKEGDVIEVEGLLGGKARRTVQWQEPQIANATGELQPGQWLGNGPLDNGLPFKIVKENTTPPQVGKTGASKAELGDTSLQSPEPVAQKTPQTQPSLSQAKNNADGLATGTEKSLQQKAGKAANNQTNLESGNTSTSTKQQRGFKSNIAKDTETPLSVYKDRKKDVFMATFLNFAGSLTSLFALWASAHSLGIDISLSQALVAYVLGNIIGGLVPTPGGIGAVEAGVYSGLLLIGVSSSEALTVTLIYRFLTYWVPIAPGYYYFWTLRKDVLKSFSFKTNDIKKIGQTA